MTTPATVLVSHIVVGTPARRWTLSRGHLTVSVRRQKGNRTTVRTHKAILKLMDRHPGAATVRDALAA